MKPLVLFFILLFHTTAILASNGYLSIPDISFINSSDTSLGEIIVCDNEPFFINGESYFESGNFEITIDGSEAGCDSVISFSILNITPVAIIDGITDVICTNDEIELNASSSEVNPDAAIQYMWEKNGLFYDDTESILAGPGPFSLTVIATIGDIVCSHTTDFEVPISPSFIPMISEVLDTLCAGDCTDITIEQPNENDTYLWDNNATSIDITVCPEITTTYSVSVTDDSGCEQIAMTTVNVFPLGNFDPLNAQICIGDTVDMSTYIDYDITLSNPSLAVIDNNVLMGLNSGTIDITLSDQNGCLQPNTNLFITIIECDPNCESKDTSIVVSLCPGNSIFGYSESGIYTDTFSIGDMCDSIVILDLNILPIYFDSLSVDLCFGQSYNGIEETSTVLDTFQSIDGCDSIIFTSIFVAELISNSISIDICDGEEYLGYTESGNYTDTLVAANGCDSLLLIDIFIIPNVDSELSVTICEGEDYDGYTEMGIYQDTLVSSQGCDSTITLDLQVIPIDKDTIDVTICDGLSFLGYTEQGQYIDTTFSPEGCAELRILNLSIIDSIFLEFDTMICPEDTLFGFVIFEEGVFSFPSTSEDGCPVTNKVTVQFFDKGCSVGINDFNNQWKVSVYPNPTHGIIELESERDFNTSLYNTNGTLLLSKNSFREKNQLDLSFLTTGIYILKLNSKDKQIIKRIIKI